MRTAYSSTSQASTVACSGELACRYNHAIRRSSATWAGYVGGPTFSACAYI
jgi:hypothetical protein